jgi:ribosomal protein S18 acetylase RimI-like enzyme
METRRLTPGDRDLLEVAVQRLIQEESGWNVPASREHLTMALADDRSYFFVTHQAGDPLGYLSAYRFPATDHDGFLVYLYDVTVAPDARRQGIGSSLVNALLQACELDGVTEVWLGTSTENVAAQRTFEATGGQRGTETFVEFTYEVDD